MIYAEFESLLVPEGNEKQVLKRIILTNSRNMLLIVMAID